MRALTLTNLHTWRLHFELIQQCAMKRSSFASPASTSRAPCRGAAPPSASRRNSHASATKILSEER
jgi:hypothetical protein